MSRSIEEALRIYHEDRKGVQKANQRFVDILTGKRLPAKQRQGIIDDFLASHQQTIEGYAAALQEKGLREAPRYIIAFIESLKNGEDIKSLNASIVHDMLSKGYERYNDLYSKKHAEGLEKAVAAMNTSLFPALRIPVPSRDEETLSL